MKSTLSNRVLDRLLALGIPSKLAMALSRLAGWLAACCLHPPVFTDDVERTRQAASLHPVLLASAASAGLYMISTAFRRPGLLVETAVYVVPVLAGLAGLGRLSRRGHPRAASWALALGLTLLLAYASGSTDGTRSPAYLVTVDVVLMAGLLLGLRAAIGFSLGFAALGGLFLAAGLSGWIVYPGYLLSPVAYFVTMQLVILIALAVLQLAVRDIRAALGRAKDEIRQRLDVESRLEFRLKLGAILASVSAAFVTADQAASDDLVAGGLSDLKQVLGADVCLLESANGEKGPPRGGSVWSTGEIQVNPDWSMIRELKPLLGRGQPIPRDMPMVVGKAYGETQELWDTVISWVPNLTSAVLIPLTSAAGAEGLLAVGWSRAPQTLGDDVLVECRTLAEIIPNGLHRISVEAALQQSLRDLSLAEDTNLDLDHRFQQLFQGSADAIYISRRDGKLVEFNPAARDMFAIPRSAAADLNATELYANVEDRREMQEALESTGSLHDYPLQLKTRDGRILDCLLTSTVRRDRNGEVIGYQGIIRDVTAERQRQEGVELHVRRLEALNRIGQAISANTDGRVTYEILLAEVLQLLGVDAADILNVEQEGSLLVFGAGKGFRTEALRHSRLRFGQGFAGRSAISRKEVFIPDLSATSSFDRSPLFEGEGFVSYCGLPLVAKGRVCGVLEMFTRRPMAPSPSWLDTARDFAAQAAIAMDSSKMFAELQRSNLDLIQAYDATLEGWAKAHDLRDHETVGHSKRVAEITVELAEALNVPGSDLVHIYRGALLHDIGKLAIPDSILQKPGPLDEGEWEIMRRHPALADQLLQGIEHLTPALPIPRFHHEHWDGSGYPRGLKGDEIPLAARIFAVVDVWDALRSDRPYRKAWSKERAMGYIQLRKDTQFDPAVVDCFLEIADRFDVLYS
jgi:PAS domain S-box-containing protein